uniref:Reverse transcriptase domain-containing protein n=1 Tax=Haemonchus contortus TaxID=6289 RepID=A0A7I4Y4U3_HAECO
MVAKATVAKAKNTGMDALNEKLDGRGGEIEIVRATSRLKIEGACPVLTRVVRLHAGTVYKDAIFIARQVMEKYQEKRGLCYLAFLKLEKAVDSLSRQVPWKALRNRKFPEHLMSLVKDMYDESTKAVRTSHGLIEATDVTAVVHLGSALSSFLFLVRLDVITNGLLNGPLKTSLHADDIALIAESRKEVQDKLRKRQRVLAENGLWLIVKMTTFHSFDESTEQLLTVSGMLSRRYKFFDAWGVI